VGIAGWSDSLADDWDSPETNAQIAGLLEWIERGGLSELPIRMTHADLAGRLPMIDRDPFDRMLVAQALVERLTLVTWDGLIQQYDVPFIEA
jgi:PIN domain nuclease of toxin-antitoxin system